MKKYDLVRLVNEKPYENYDLIKNMRGIVVDENEFNVMFFNPKDVGDYAIVKLNEYDVEKEKETLPENLINELDLKIKINALKAKNKTFFKDIKVNAYDKVELIRDSARYADYGIYRGDTGCVMENYAVNGFILVDFSGVDKNGNYYGDCISVKIDDLKVL